MLKIIQLPYFLLITNEKDEDVTLKINYPNILTSRFARQACGQVFY